MLSLLDIECAGIKIGNQIPQIVHTIITLIKIGVPILLIIFGMLDLGKAVMAQKDDEIKKGQQTLIKRVIAAAIVFFVVTIVQILVGVVAGNDEEKNEILGCMSCFVNGPESAECTSV